MKDLPAAAATEVYRRHQELHQQGAGAVLPINGGAKKDRPPDQRLESAVIRGLDAEKTIFQLQAICGGGTDKIVQKVQKR